MELDAERQIDVTWDSNSELLRPISLRVITDDRGGMLADISAVFTKMNLNISEAKCKTFGDGQAVNTFKCGIKNLEQLKKATKMLESIKGVHSVERTKGTEK